MDKQLFNLNADVLGGYTGIYIKFVIAIILVYCLIIAVSFLRDKFLKPEQLSKTPQIVTLLGILNKLCYFSGFGFIIANIVQVIFSQMPTHNKPPVYLGGVWDHLAFGIILIFMGIGFKAANKVVIIDK